MNNFGNFCNHQRTINPKQNYTKCIDCGYSWVSQTNIRNKTSDDFAREFKNIDKKFARNFDNTFQDDEDWKIKYMDDAHEKKKQREQNNPITFFSQIEMIQSVMYPFPVDNAGRYYKIDINGKIKYITKTEINEHLKDTMSIKI
jgi:hypothetical protein